MTGDARPKLAKKPPPSAVQAAAPTPVPPTGPVIFDEGDSTFIMVAPPAKQPPLFSTEEYKQRGLQKQ